jgi:hypothetical protein
MVADLVLGLDSYNIAFDADFLSVVDQRGPSDGHRGRRFKHHVHNDVPQGMPHNQVSPDKLDVPNACLENQLIVYDLKDWRAIFVVRAHESRVTHV